MFCVAYDGGSKMWLGTRSVVLTEKHTQKGMSHLVSEAGELCGWECLGGGWKGALGGRAGKEGLAWRWWDSEPLLSSLSLAALSPLSVAGRRHQELGEARAAVHHSPSGGVSERCQGFVTFLGVRKGLLFNHQLPYTGDVGLGGKGLEIRVWTSQQKRREMLMIADIWDRAWVSQRPVFQKP